MCPEMPRTFHNLQELTMATATTNTSTKATPESEIPDTAQKIREQVLSTVKKGQQLSVDAAQTWAKAVSALPVHNLPDLPKIPGLPAMPGMEAATNYTFDVAADLLNAQRDFALQLTSTLVPAKTS
jgi:hypothetical protein